MNDRPMTDEPTPKVVMARPADAEADRRCPQRMAALPHGHIAWREAGADTGLPAVVFLHGIGSGSGSWLDLLQRVGRSRRALAWDAPGYGESGPLPVPRPLAADYALVLGQWLQAAGVRELVLVGHSLGALVAAAWAAQHRGPAQPRLHNMVLASPARGYGSAEPAQREAKYRERVDSIERLGPAGLAQARAAALCAPGAPAQALATVRAHMARVSLPGYGQAAHMLAHDDLLPLVQRRQPTALGVRVTCGLLDTITPPAACEALAQAAGLPYVPLPGLGHACYVEDPAAFEAALADSLAVADGLARASSPSAPAEPSPASDTALSPVAPDHRP